MEFAEANLPVLSTCDRFLRKTCPYFEQLTHMQRLQSLGLMVGEIAHDLNNVLSMALGQLELLALEKDFSEAQRKQLAFVKDAICDGGGLCRSMLMHAGKAKPLNALFDAGSLFSEIQQFFRSTIPQRITFEYEADSRLPVLRGEASEVRQIFLNLLLNALESLEGETGRIRFCVRTCQGQDAPRDVGPCCVHARISDTGCGMDAELQARLFEPFFTTKTLGGGLGLAAVKQLLDTMGGTINVESTPGEGSTFDVYVPAQFCELANDDDAAASPNECSVEPLNGTVLLVDDEKDLRRIGSDGLKRMGLDVLCAGDGVEAISCYETHGHAIDLVLMDADMPRMDGCEAFKSIRSIDAAAPVILISGYTEADLSPRLGALEPDCQLLKPVSLGLLQKTVASLLGNAK